MWIVTPSHQSQRYHSISHTIVHEVSKPIIHQSSIEVTTAFTISLDQEHTSLIISGHIDTVRFNRENQSTPDNNSLTLPLSFEGELGSTTLTITVKNHQVSDKSCSPFISSILSDVRTTVAIYPTRLTPGLTWKDSTLIKSCTTQGVPTTRKTLQSFRVVGEKTFNATKAIFLQRVDSTYTSGDGAEGNHEIHLTGIGTGTANIYISPITAATLSTELVEKTEIAITNSGKTRQFIQEVTQRLTATN
ncbi:MAG: hypothetical protein ABR582_00795 [Gemmatimonadaceae bacterium]